MYKIIIGLLFIFFIVGCEKKSDEKYSEQSGNSNNLEIKVTKNVLKKTQESSEINKQNSGQFYYSYNQAGKSKEADIIRKYEEDTKKARTTLDAYLNIKSPYERVKIEMMIKQLSKDYILKCSACHNDYANGVIGPSLLGKDAEFIYNKIIDFKTGKRENILMKELVSQIDNNKLKALAKEIANFNENIQKLRRKDD